MAQVQAVHSVVHVIGSHFHIVVHAYLEYKFSVPED